MTLNVDTERDRCKIKELNAGKLRRVAFNVDVEIAGVSNYGYDEDVSPDRKDKDKKIKERGEGDALKHPELAEQVVEGGGSTRTASNAGLYSSMSLNENDWGTSSPRSPKDSKSAASSLNKPANKKTSKPQGPAHGSLLHAMDEDWGLDTGKPEETRAKPIKKNSTGSGSGEHDILKHLSAMDDDWGGDSKPTNSRSKQSKKVTRGTTSLFGSLALDEFADDADNDPRPRAASIPPRARKASDDPRRDMMAVLADDDWSEQNTPARGSPAQQSPALEASAGPTMQNTYTPSESRSPRSPKPNLGRTISTTLPLSIGQPAVPDSKTTPSSGANLQMSAPQQGQTGLQPPIDVQNRGTSPSPAGRPQDKPTTDPLRIYRRCCQLREAPVLKRISEQLAKPENSNAEGIVGTLNLNRSRMQLIDIVCLSDWLAIVPVKKITIEDANLTDEGLRQILAGLLATKTPDLAKRRRGRSSPTQRGEAKAERYNPGVIEKLSLKGNRKLTEEGWKHLCVFINMSKSIRSIDVSLVPFPKRAPDAENAAYTIADIFCKALVEKPIKGQISELLMADCGLSAQQVERVTRAASRGLERLGLANNALDEDGLRHVARYLKAGVCKGLDLGGNNLRGKTHLITAAMKDPLIALSVANCNLLPSDLDQLLPQLVALPDLRFLDISHNRELFSATNGSVSLTILRKLIPRFKLLKRIHLADVTLTPAQAIGIAEVVPECRNLAHINILENPLITAAISDTGNQAHQEEACALFASLMTAARLSKTLVCVDVDVPGPTASEVVKALARQVVAYCLRNIEVFTEADAAMVADAAAALPDIDKSNDSGIELLQHFLEHSHSDGTPKGQAATEDYFVGGTGVVKALSYILNASQAHDVYPSRPGTPNQVLESDLGKAQAKEMSRTLLESARKYRNGLQPVLKREMVVGDQDIMRKGSSAYIVSRPTNQNYIGRLNFLDDTLRRIIERFELEYPSVRPGSLSAAAPTPASNDSNEAPTSIRSRASSVDSASSRNNYALGESYTSETGFAGGPPESPSVWRNTYPFTTDIHTPGSGTRSPANIGPRRESQVDLHNRELVNEEGYMHRFGQRLRREIFPPTGQTDYLHHTSAGGPPDPEHLAALRAKYEAWGGDEIRQMFMDRGLEEAIRELADDGEMLREMELTDPEAFRKYREAQIMAQESGMLGEAGAGGRGRGFTL